MAEGCILPATRYLANSEFASPLNLERAGWAALARGEYAELCTGCHEAASTRGVVREPGWVKQAP